MASIVSGFEYDIFISYRHNDNRSGWVREFVHQLNEELAATLKDPVSIYFDENPHDGLRETDIVDDSLKGKLKCLIFIPILSQTYCDPKSFAWTNEFLVFKREASEDTIGLKVKLSNSNTTCRILPIRIHDLDTEDRALIEKETGPLRSVDFIFKSIGVNRPLMPSDNPDKNQNKTFYRDQVNKVANCVKEIVDGLKGGSRQSMPDHPRRQSQISHPARGKKIAITAAVALFLSIGAFLVYHFFQPETDLLDKSIAVLAFDDLSENHDQEYFSDGISEELINALVKIEGLKVPSRTSSFWFKGKDADLKEVGEKLNVALIVEGSVRKSGDKLRITAQLIDAKNGYHLWSETYDHNAKDIFKAQDEVAKDIVKQLQRRLRINGMLPERKLPTQNLEAYDLYLKGHKYFLMKGKHVIKAREYLEEAVKLDPSFAMAHAALAEAYGVTDLSMGNPKEALNSAYRALALDSSLSSAYAVIAWIHGSPAYRGATETEHTDMVHLNFEKAIKLDPQNSTAHLWFGITMMRFGLLDQAVSHLQTAVEIDPLVAINYGILGWAEYVSGLDSAGYLHLSEGIRLGWDAGIQRLGFYYLEHQQWDKAENSFKEHAAKITMSTDLDYHKLILAVQKKDIQAARSILDSIVSNKGFTSGFKVRIYFLVGDYERAIEGISDWGITEGMRPGRKALRNQPAFRKYLKDNGLVSYWKKYGWPPPCVPVGESDFECN